MAGVMPAIEIYSEIKDAPAMTNRIIELVREIKIEQNKPRDEEKETDEQYHERLALEDEWIAGIYYKGNSVSWSHSKSVNYGHALSAAWSELQKLGVPCDGKTSVADAIAKFTMKKPSQ